MSERYKIKVRVMGKKGICAHGHEVGEEWIIDGKTPPRMCVYAFHAMFPPAYVMMYGGSFPWEPDPDVFTLACPDAKNQLTFELQRLHE
jgi:uncharacterized repeat protein (TIGR04076 family)